MNSFFGIGIMELFLIAIVALLVLGPERLPHAIRETARYIRMLRNLSSEFTSQFSEELKILDDVNPQKLLQELIDDPAETKKPAAKPAKKTPVKKTPVKKTPAAKKPASSASENASDADRPAPIGKAVAEPTESTDSVQSVESAATEQSDPVAIAADEDKPDATASMDVGTKAEAERQESGAEIPESAVDPDHTIMPPALNEGTADPVPTTANGTTVSVPENRHSDAEPDGPQKAATQTPADTPIDAPIDSTVNVNGSGDAAEDAA